MNELPLWKFPHILMTACHMPDEAWAQLMGLSEAEAAKWLDRDIELGKISNDRLLLLHQLITHLGRSHAGAGIGKWMTSSFLELDMMRPVDWIGSEREPAPLLLLARREAARQHGISPSSAYWPQE